jgi:hypothetical protein
MEVIIVCGWEIVSRECKQLKPPVLNAIRPQLEKARKRADVLTGVPSAPTPPAQASAAPAPSIFGSKADALPANRGRGALAPTSPHQHAPQQPPPSAITHPLLSRRPPANGPPLLSERRRQ